MARITHFSNPHEPMCQIQSWPIDAPRPDPSRESADQPEPHSFGYCRLSNVEYCRSDWLANGIPEFYWKRCDAIDAEAAR